MWPRALATQALSIFGDHSDVMATRATGFALLASNSVQEAQDLALIAHASTMEARVPFLHFFDGFRTSHEIDKIEQVSREDMRAMIDDRFVQAHRQRALSQEFTPAMVKGIFDEMCKAEPKRRFTVEDHARATAGIECRKERLRLGDDDVPHLLEPGPWCEEVLWMALEELCYPVLSNSRR